MSKPTTITTALQAAINASGLTHYRIACGAGMAPSVVSRFMLGQGTLRLDKADRLAAYLGLRLTPDPDATPPAPTPENLARPMLAKRKPTRRPRTTNAK